MIDRSCPSAEQLIGPFLRLRLSPSPCSWSLAHLYVHHLVHHDSFSAHTTLAINSNRSNHASLSKPTFSSPTPTTIVRVSPGSFRNIKLASCEAIKCPIISLSSPPAPNNVFGLICEAGSASSPIVGSAVSKAVGEAVESGTCICST